MTTVVTGNKAEQAVAQYLQSLGYKVLFTNWKIKIAEIDIIAQKESVIYFIEVKYRSTDKAGDGFDYITSNKLHHMERAAQAWTLQYNWQGPYELMAAAISGEGPSYNIDVRKIT